MPGNVAFAYDSASSSTDDVFAHLGASGLELGAGSAERLGQRQRLHRMSGNGLEIGGVDGQPPRVRHARDDDNHLYGLPREYHGGVGIVNGYTQHTTIAHNQIDHVAYPRSRWAGAAGPTRSATRRPRTPSHDNTVTRQPDLRLHAAARRRRRRSTPRA